MFYKKEKSKKKLLEEKEVNDRSGEVSVVDKVVFFTLLILLILSPFINRLRYAELPALDSEGAIRECNKSELLYEGKIYELDSNYELYPIRIAAYGSRQGCFILNGPYIFERAKEEGIYAKCWDADGSESIEVAGLDGEVYLHPADGYYYRSRIIKSKSNYFFDGVEQIKNGTLDEWIAEILRNYE